MGAQAATANKAVRADSWLRHSVRQKPQLTADFVDRQTIEPLRLVEAEADTIVAWKRIRDLREEDVAGLFYVQEALMWYAESFAPELEEALAPSPERATAAEHA